MIFKPDNDRETRVMIYDANGRRIRYGTYAQLAARGFAWTWDYTDLTGQRLAKGFTCWYYGPTTW